MRIERALVGLLFIATAAAGGCGRLAYNTPPASRLMEPGPGVGGPGPGVIPPAGSPNGMLGGAVNRFGGGMGGPGMGGGMCAQMGPGAPGDGNFQPHQAHPDVMQASFNAPMSSPGACSCGPGMRGDGCMQAGFFHGGCQCMRPGSTEAYADGAGGAGGISTSQIAFLGDDGVQVSWDVSGAGLFDSTPLVIPGRQDFYQASIYRLKLSHLPGRPNVQLYPTLEVAPVTPRTDAYLAHSPIPVQFTEEDFDQVVSGNFVTKVIYLPDPEFQELALAGVETLVSTRLDPGVDPIVEADRRGSILAIVRIGNKDLELNAGASGQPQTIVPAHHEEAVKGSWIPPKHSAQREQQKQAEPILQPFEEQSGEHQSAGEVAPAQYCEGDAPCMGDGYCEGNAPCTGDGYCEGNAPNMGGGYCGGGSNGNMPMGMPTSGFAPTAVPPNMIAGAPQWGMPITGTPIGLPGPPHIPLGTPAGLQKHVMKNRTKVVVPPPVTKMEFSVKERPGHNYPRPVDHVEVDEAQREPFRLLPAWMTGALHHDQSCNQCNQPYPQ